MNSVRKWDITKPDLKKQCIDHVLTVIDQLDGVEPGVIFAEELMQTISSVVGPEFYNMGVTDAKKLIETKLADLEVDMDVLTQR